MSSGSKRAGRAGSRKSDSEGSIFGGTSRESDSGGWLVRSFNEADDTASETAAPRDGLFDRSTRNSGSMMDGEKRDGIGLYGDKEPGEM